MTKHSKSILVVGGGAAGMMAALVAAERGAQVTVLERMDKVGKKILVTGNGRCNITNSRQDLAHYHGAPAEFIEQALRSSPVSKTLEFFKSLGLECVEEEEGRVYPSCGQASAVLNVLRFEMDRRNVRVVSGAEVSRLTRDGHAFKADTKDGRMFPADNVIVAAGGKASPQLGSNGSGFDLMKSLGHPLRPTFPVLVQLNLQAPFLKEVDGVRFNGSAAVVSQGRVCREECGEIQLTDYGASGIPILDLSRSAGECLMEKREAFLELKLLLGRSAKTLSDEIQTRLSARSDETIERALVGLVHSQLLPPLIHLAGYKNKHVPCRLSSPENVRNLAQLLTSWKLPIIGAQPWERAHATAGGVDSAVIDPGTMESKICPGLYAAGEIVDVDGDCGGYNLQWAWSSGFVAGLAASR